MSTCACTLTCSSARWPTVPIPEVDQRIVPGLARDWASMSAKLLPVNEGVPSRIIGAYMTLMTGAMSFCGSYGSLPKCGLRVSGLTAEKPSV